MIHIAGVEEDLVKHYNSDVLLSLQVAVILLTLTLGAGAVARQQSFMQMSVYLTPACVIQSLFVNFAEPCRNSCEFSGCTAKTGVNYLKRRQSETSTVPPVALSLYCHTFFQVLVQGGAHEVSLKHAVGMCHKVDTGV